MENDDNACPKCGAPQPQDAPGGACPQCLLTIGLETEHVSGSEGAKAASPSIPDIARVFPELEILSVLGRGGMGIVYKARQPALDRMVALKILPAKVLEVPGFAERFTREARLLGRLDHPGIVRIHDFGKREGMFYLVLEYVDGLNIRQLMTGARLTPQQALAIVPQICEALEYAHSRGVVHRDIKPENLLMTQEGRVKIADFGLARVVEAAQDRTLTVAGDVMGTPHYMAPEQIDRPTEVDHRADIYSLGVVFYEMLTGELPLGRFRPPSEKVSIDVRLDEVVLRALERERERRYQSVADVRTEVRHITQTASAPRTAAPASAATAAKPRLSRMAVVGCLGMPVAIVVWLLAHPAAIGLIVAMEFSAWILCIVAWVLIATSKGTLRGLGYAITGTLVPPCIFMLILPLSCLFLGITEKANSPPKTAVETGDPAPREPMVVPK